MMESLENGFLIFNGNRLINVVRIEIVNEYIKFRELYISPFIVKTEKICVIKKFKKIALNFFLSRAYFPQMEISSFRVNLHLVDKLNDYLDFRELCPKHFIE
jgi:hypothetical protein